MRANSLAVAVLVCALGVSGCTPPSPAGPQGSGPASSTVATAGTPSATGPAIPPGVDVDAAAAVPLVIGADGGRVAVTSGTWTAVVAVPKGAGTAGATWTVYPLRSAPAGLPAVLSPGVYVDEAGQPPTGDCLIGFVAPVKADADAAIYRLPADGGSAELVATDRQQIGQKTMLVAEVSGFSSYGVGKASAADRSAAKKKRTQQQPSHHTISVHDKVSFTVQDWKFSVTVNVTLVGGGANPAGNYKGTGAVLYTGKYNKTLGGIIKTLGNVRYTGKGRATACLYGDLAPLAPLFPNSESRSYEMEDPSGFGSIIVQGSGALDALATAPVGTMKAPGIKVKDGVQLPFLIKVEGSRVTLEIAGIGEFSGTLK